MDRSTKLYVILTAMFTSVMLISNVIGVKVIQAPLLPHIPLTVGTLTYPFTFLITDLVSELWGGSRARLMVYIAFAMNLLLVAALTLAAHMPEHPAWVSAGIPFGYQTATEMQTAFQAVFQVNGIMAIGSLSAYLISQLLDVKLYCQIRKWTDGKHLWLRNNGSTLASQLVDTSVVTLFFVIFGLHGEYSQLLPLMISAYGYKLFFALCDTPFLYLATWGAKKYLGQPNEPVLSPV